MTLIQWHRSGQVFLALAAERRTCALLTPVGRRGRYWKDCYKRDLVNARVRRLAKQGVLSETAAFDLLGKLLRFENLEEVSACVC